MEMNLAIRNEFGGIDYIKVYNYDKNFNAAYEKAINECVLEGSPEPLYNRLTNLGYAIQILEHGKKPDDRWKEAYGYLFPRDLLKFLRSGAAKGLTVDEVAALLPQTPISNGIRNRFWYFEGGRMIMVWSKEDGRALRECLEKWL